MINQEHVSKSYTRISSYIHKTPIITCRYLDQLFNASIFFKCENLQKTGAFKFRGALNAVLQENSKTLCAHSSGNHGAALAHAATLNNKIAHIVVPKNTPKSKLIAMETYGAKLTLCEPNNQSRITELKNLQSLHQATIIHPYDNERVIAGAGTVALELLEQVSELTHLFVPIGGGGLISGIALWTKHKYPNIKIIGVEPTGAHEASLSIEKGSLIELTKVHSICEGLLAPISARTFEIISHFVDEIVLAEDSTTAEMVKIFAQRTKLIIEPSSATILTAMQDYSFPTHSRVGAVLSGGNVDLNRVFN